MKSWLEVVDIELEFVEDFTRQYFNGHGGYKTEALSPRRETKAIRVYYQEGEALPLIAGRVLLTPSDRGTQIKVLSGKARHPFGSEIFEGFLRRLVAIDRERIVPDANPTQLSN